MYRLKYNNVEYCLLLLGGKVFCLMFGLVRDNNMNGLIFGVWNVEFWYRECFLSFKGGFVDLWGGYRNDELCYSFGKFVYLVYNIIVGSKRRNIR